MTVAAEPECGRLAWPVRDRQLAELVPQMLPEEARLEAREGHAQLEVNELARIDGAGCVEVGVAEALKRSA